MYKKCYYSYYAANDTTETDKFFNYVLDEYLKYKKDEPKLRFVMDLSFKNLFNIETEQKIDEIIEILEKNGIKREDITISINKDNHRYKAKEWELVKVWEKEIVKKGVVFGFDDIYKTWSTKEVEIANSKLNQTVDKIKQTKCSPYEMLLMGYLTVTQREYLAEKDDEHGSKSRSVYGVLNNEEIVCQGYAEYLKAIIEMVGDENIKVYNNQVATSSDNKTIDAYHANLVIYIKDEKYGIDGYYYLDPTWDSLEDNEVPNLTYFMVPINDIKNFKIDHIRNENLLPVSENSDAERTQIKENGDKDETDDFILEDKVDNSVQITADDPVLSTMFVKEFLKNHPSAFDGLIDELKQQKFEEDYERMESLEKIVKLEQEVFEMFNGNNIHELSSDDYFKLKQAIETFEVDLEEEKIFNVVNQIIERYYTLEIKEDDSKGNNPCEFIEKEIEIIGERLRKANLEKSKEFTKDDVYGEIMGNERLFSRLYEEITKTSTPIHAGKTMEALRVVYSKFNPEIMPKLVDKRVRETIEFNVQRAKRHYTKKSNNPFLEIYNLNHTNVKSK